MTGSRIATEAASRCDPQWTIVTVTYNSSETLLNYWAEIRPESVQWIVVDNASTDNSVEVAKKLGARVIQLAENVGFSAANNVGWRAGSGQFIGFVNPDVAVEYDDLPGIRSRLEGVGGLAAPQLLNPDGSPQPNGRGAPFLTTKFRNRLKGSDSLVGSYLLYAEIGQVMPVWWVTGAAVFATRADVEALGGWDESYFLYQEDADLSIRAWTSGLPVAVLGEYRWTHGWARESARVRLKPILAEAKASRKFYSTYPALIAKRFLGRSWRVDIAEKVVAEGNVR